MTFEQRILQLRVLALQNVRTGYPEHQMRIRALRYVRQSKLASAHNQQAINHLAWRYREQIRPDLWPVPAVLLGKW